MKNIPIYVLLSVIFSSVWSIQVFADDVLIEDVTVKYDKPSWTFHVTLRHDDEGWEHYADAWRVIGADDKIFGTRTLFHPHESEQPFTRSLNGVSIPANLKVVYIEAHDKVHGWSPEKFKVNLSK